MIDAPLVLAFTAGMVASVNPCGFSLLPAYIGMYVVGENPAMRVEYRIARAVGVAMAVSTGFVLVFASAGIVLDQISSTARRQLPWVTIVIGTLLVIAGCAVAAGWTPRLIRGELRLGSGTGISSMIGYGATYAIASLSCTVGPFLAITGAALDRSTLGGLVTYVVYALGMGVIILAISVATAVARTAVIGNLRRVSRFAPRIGGLLMIAAGGYAIWYGRWELAVYDGDLSTDPIINAGEDLRRRVVTTVESIGAVRLALVVLILSTFVVALSAALHEGRHRRAQRQPKESDEMTEELDARVLRSVES